MSVQGPDPGNYPVDHPGNGLRVPRSLTSRDFQLNKYDYFDWMRTHEPVFRGKMYLMNVVCSIFLPALLKIIKSSTDLFDQARDRFISLAH